MNSIRTQLLVSLGLCATCILALSFTIVYTYVSSALEDNYDGELARRVHAFARMAEIEGESDGDEDSPAYHDRGDDQDNVVHFEFAELGIPEYQSGPSPAYYQVWNEAGMVLARSPSLKGRNLPRMVVPAGDVVFQDVLLPDGHPGRLAVVAFEPIDKESEGVSKESSVRLILAVARSMKTLESTLGILLVSLLVSGAATTIVMLLLVWVMVRRSLGPLDRVCFELSQVNVEDLSYTFDTHSRPGELQPICERLNELLERLRNSFDRERRFTSNVAHELRTPIAELHTLAEVSLMRGNIGSAEKRSLEDALDIACGMERVITALLDIARCNSGQMGTQKESLNLADLVRNAWVPFEKEARARQLWIDLKCGEVIPLVTDPVLFGTILANLFSNAVSYTPVGGVIQLFLVESNDFLTVSLSNETEDLNREDLVHIYESFWRKNNDDADPRHAGVGLSLVMALAQVLGITVESDMSASNRFQISLRHPI